MKGITATENGEEGAPSAEAAAELQIQIAGMFRKVCNEDDDTVFVMKLQLSRIIASNFNTCSIKMYSTDISRKS